MKFSKSWLYRKAIVLTVTWIILFYLFDNMDLSIGIFAIGVGIILLIDLWIPSEKNIKDYEVNDPEEVVSSQPIEELVKEAEQKLANENKAKLEVASIGIPYSSTEGEISIVMTSANTAKGEGMVMLGSENSVKEADKRSITQKVLEHLQEGNLLTSDQCKDLFEYNRLNAIIYKLKKRGFKIESANATKQNVPGKSVQIKIYRLETE